MPLGRDYQRPFEEHFSQAVTAQIVTMSPVKLPSQNAKKNSNGSIAVIDASKAQRETLVQFLEIEGYTIQVFDTIVDFEENKQADDFEVIIIDVNFGDENELFWLKNQKTYFGRGIVIISKHSDPMSKVKGRKCGADDYLFKPVLLEEASLVVHNLLTRLRKKTDETWTLFTREWVLQSPFGHLAKLTYNEKTILEVLGVNPGEVASKETIAEKLGYSPSVYDFRRLEIIIRRLRNKIEHQLGIRLPLETANRKGYSFTASIQVQENH